MAWYYLNDAAEQVGPISESDFLSKVESGELRDDTLIWREGMSNWCPLGEIDAATPGSSEPESGESLTCTECGRSFPAGEVLAYRDRLICAQCKPAFFQRRAEGVPDRGAYEFGGFWIRFGAKTVDSLLVLGVLYALGFLFLGLSFETQWGVEGEPQQGDAVAFALFTLLQFVLPAAYETFFVGRYAATPGKMLCGLRVIRPDGERVTYLRAFGRHLGEYISYFILLIGYIMAAFDREKRALHDHICDTRVVRK